MQKKTHNRYINKIYKMNTQRKIFEVLAKKQELGEIEDAINAAVARAESYINDLLDTSDSYSQELVDIVDSILSASEAVNDASSRNNSLFNEQLSQIETMIEELESEGGVNFDRAMLDKIIGEYQDLKPVENKIAQLSANSFYS